MKTVNFLPHWYFQEQRDRRRQHLGIGLMLVLGGAMVTWAADARIRIRDQRQQRDEVQHQAAALRDLTPPVDRAEQENRRLENLQLAYRDLGNTVPMSAVIQQLPNNMTPGMALSSINIDVRPEPVKSAVIDARTPQRFHDVARLTVVGIAPNDLLIAQLIGKISTNPLFGEVSLNYSRTETLRSSLVRRFQIQMNIDLDRLAAENPAQRRDQASASAQQAHDARQEGDHAL